MARYAQTDDAALYEVHRLVADGQDVQDACAAVGISRATYYRHRKRIGRLAKAARPVEKPPPAPVRVVETVHALEDCGTVCPGDVDVEVTDERAVVLLRGIAEGQSIYKVAKECGVTVAEALKLINNPAVRALLAVFDDGLRLARRLRADQFVEILHRIADGTTTIHVEGVGEVAPSHECRIKASDLALRTIHGLDIKGQPAGGVNVNVNASAQAAAGAQAGATGIPLGTHAEVLRAHGVQLPPALAEVLEAANG